MTGDNIQQVVHVDASNILTLSDDSKLTHLSMQLMRLRVAIRVTLKGVALEKSVVEAIPTTDQPRPVEQWCHLRGAAVSISTQLQSSVLGLFCVKSR